MKFITKQRKFFSILFLLLTVTSVIQPSITYALTTGPHQPEYTSYEQPGATDIVNLLTGDFTYSLPILEVPGPEGSFSVPLTYNAGIGPEQEASWVGLGWTLNVGAITREINQYPDDASGEVQSITMKDLTGLRGWSSSVMGLGQVGWNNQQGGYGSVSLGISASWNRDGWSADFGGLIASSNGPSINGVQLVSTIASLATPVSAAMLNAGEAVGMQMSNLSIGAMIPSAPGITTTNGYWQYSETVKHHLTHTDYWIWLDQTRNEKMYGISNMDKATPTNTTKSIVVVGKDISNQIYYEEQLAFNVNNNDVSTKPLLSYYDINNTGAASDVNYYVPQSQGFNNAKSAAVLATDNFSVKGPGISGIISPYRLDVGSVSMPLAMSQYHLRLMPVNYSSYKVPFIYKGSLSSNYLNHTGNSTPNFNFGLACQIQSQYPPSGNTIDFAQFTLTDPIFDVNKVRADVQSNGYELPQASHVEWLSNSEISAAAGSFTNGFMDYFSSPSRSQFRQNYTFNNPQVFYCYSSSFPTDGILALNSAEDSYFQVGQSVTLNAILYNSSSDLQNIVNGTPLTQQTTTVTSIDQAGVHVNVPSSWTQYNGKYFSFIASNSAAPKSPSSIGGFSVTGDNGLTYHFALPIYDYNFSAYAESATNSSQNTTIQRTAPFANTWLLTAVTGPDFVDRSSGGAANGVVDTSDWGYWVKFNYGKYSDNYQWRIPYSQKTIDETGDFNQFSQGAKQLYYLNSIETRSHAAIFIKDVRNDNRDASTGQTGLRLSEIALLRRDDYRSLISTYGLPDDSGTITSNWMNSQFYPSGSNTAAGTFVIQSALRRIKFSHAYDLCSGTPNSAGLNSQGVISNGKLTLNRLSIIGRNGTQVVPDYLFGYGSNPNYDPNKWDGWGLYNSFGTSANNTHTASTNDVDGAAWSLSQITTPQGSTISVAYERDKYGSISGSTIATGSFSYSTTALPYTGANAMNIVGTGTLVSGDIIQLSGTATATCPANNQQVTGSISGNYMVMSVQPPSNVITVSTNYGSITSCQTGTSTSISYSGTYKKVSPINGGGIRVGSITLQDQSNVYKTRYLYTNDDGTGSGVIAQEPSYTKTISYDYNNIPRYPMTPVVYSKVSVLSGALTTDTDYNTKEVYQFETPNTNLFSLNSDSIQYNAAPSTATFSWLYSIKKEISDYSEKIGSLKSRTVFDAANNVTSSTSLTYTSQLNNSGANNYQGLFSEGTLMFDDILYPIDYSGNTVLVYGALYKMTRSSIIHYPYTLQSIVTTKDGFTTEADNISWDFVSGQVVEKNNTNASGVKTKTVTVPAYTIASYSQMGPKAFDVTNNKNMLTQIAAEYVYRLDALGNITGLISGQASTWNNTWNNYRDFNTSTNTYVEGPGTPATNVWRKNKTYAYKGAVTDVQSDGSIQFNTSANLFSFSSSSNTNWQQTSEMTRYDHYSLPVEQKNSISGIYSSSKRDFNNRFILASASNANYYEFAYSGAEDGDNTSVYFGGEVARGNGSVVTGTPGTVSHTGQAAVQVAAGSNSFIYNPVALTPNRTYRAQVWTNSTSGAIYYKINGAASPTTVVPLAANKAGNWYKVIADIPIPSTFTSLEVGVTSTSGTISFDDFRFQPLDGSLQASVYDASTGYLTYVLGNDNSYTRYQYDDRGIIMKTFSESIKYNGERLVSERKDDYKRFHTN